jgi:Raf kinase inhibitor-like YbhB/YbcL family protein
MRHVMRINGIMVAGGALLVALFIAPVMAQPVQDTAGFALSSPSLKDGGYLTLKNGGNNKASQYCLGENVSPPFQWSNAPASTRSFAFIMVDLQGRAGQGLDHFVSYGIPAFVTGFAEGEISKPSETFVGGKGLTGVGTYLGPCVPPASLHHYAFTLIATDLDPKELPPGLTRDELLSKLVGHSKEAATLIGLFRHPQENER